MEDAISKRTHIRSRLGRELAYDRNYKLYKKDMLMAYIWWMFAAAFGFHRFSMGDIKIGVAILLTTVFVLVLSSFLSSLTLWIFVPYTLLLFFEAVIIPFRVKKINSDLSERLKQEYGLE